MSRGTDAPRATGTGVGRPSRQPAAASGAPVATGAARWRRRCAAGAAPRPSWSRRLVWVGRLGARCSAVARRRGAPGVDRRRRPAQVRRAGSPTCRSGDPLARRRHRRPSAPGCVEPATRRRGVGRAAPGRGTRDRRGACRAAPVARRAGTAQGRLQARGRGRASPFAHGRRTAPEGVPVVTRAGAGGTAGRPAAVARRARRAARRRCARQVGRRHASSSAGPGRPCTLGRRRTVVWGERARTRRCKVAVLTALLRPGEGHRRQRPGHAGHPRPSSRRRADAPDRCGR